jgi:hypothetical protein
VLWGRVRVAGWMMEGRGWVEEEDTGRGVREGEEGRVGTAPGGSWNTLLEAVRFWVRSTSRFSCSATAHTQYHSHQNSELKTIYSSNMELVMVD